MTSTCSAAAKPVWRSIRPDSHRSCPTSSFAFSPNRDRRCSILSAAATSRVRWPSHWPGTGSALKSMLNTWPGRGCVSRMAAQPERRAGIIGPMDLDAKVCYCFHVTRRKLVNFVRQTRPKVPSQLSQCGGAGTGCGWCIPFLKQLHEQAVAGGVTELERLSPAEYERRRAEYIRGGKGTPPPGAAALPPESPLAD